MKANKGTGFKVLFLKVKIYSVKEGWNLLEGDGDVPSHVGSDGVILRIWFFKTMIHNRFYKK
jgi:hypothetical protein